MIYFIYYLVYLWSDSFTGAKDPLKFASLSTCGFVAQLVVAPNRYLGGTGSSLRRSLNFFSGFNFCNCFNYHLVVKINSLLVIMHRSNMIYLYMLFVH